MGILGDMGGSLLRNRFVQAGLLALGGVVMFGGAAAVLAQPDDGTDAAGMLAMSLVFLALAVCMGSVGVLFQAQLGKALGLQARPAPAAPAGWYRVEARGGEWMWWDGRAWADLPPTGE